jgi:hypothetical protein
MIRTARQILFVLKYAVCGALLLGLAVLVFSSLSPSAFSGSLYSFSSDSETEILSFSADHAQVGPPQVHSPIRWIGFYIGLLVGWAIGWHRLREKKSKIVWRAHRGNNPSAPPDLSRSGKR